MRYAILAALASLGVASPASAAVNLVVNGGFELLSPGYSGSFMFGATVPGRERAVPGWSTNSKTAFNYIFNSATAGTVGASMEFPSSSPLTLWNYVQDPRTGKNFLGMDGDATVRDPVTQMINGLVPGKVYTLSFDWGAAQMSNRNGATTEQIQVNFGGSEFKTEVISNANHGYTGFRRATTNFTATSTSQLLSFLSIGTPVGLPPMAVLDNVSLTSATVVQGGVPEPATWMMMISGFGVVGAAMRRRRRSDAVTAA